MEMQQANRVPLDYLKTTLEQAERSFPVGSRWRHYKGAEFIVTGFDISEQTNAIYIRYAYPEDVVLVLKGARSDKWGMPVNAAVAQAEFSLHINLFDETLEVEGSPVQRFTKVSND